ncbi:MAG TPA: hydrogenase maturation protease [Spirochaetota bacterium]|nr:hydrogenase maturation protease [Spirochaetota bacterium]HPS87720.1 hydrogenase maturation protease [Spirochaetota bacterium]
MKKFKSKKVLILGIGNILHKDDGLGVFIVNEIINSVKDLPKNIEVADGGVLGYDLLSLMSGRERIVIVDALKADDKPGSVYKFPAKYLIDSNNKFSLHEMGVKKIIDMLSLTGENPEIEIIGVVPEDINSLEIGISDSVKKSIPKAVEYILDAAVKKPVVNIIPLKNGSRGRASL